MLYVIISVFSFCVGFVVMAFAQELVTFKNYFNSKRFKDKLFIMKLITSMYFKPNLNNILMFDDSLYLVKTDEMFYIISTNRYYNYKYNNIVYSDSLDNMNFIIVENTSYYEIMFDGYEFTLYVNKQLFDSKTELQLRIENL